jgi:ribosome-associated heat shock protein Hsp15
MAKPSKSRKTHPKQTSPVEPDGRSPPWQRLDKWLWCARLLRTRSACTRFVLENALRLNRAPVSGPDQRVRVGDVLTLMKGGRVVVWRVRALAERRGPAAAAALLYECCEADSPPFPMVADQGDMDRGDMEREERLLHCEKDRRISPASRSGEIDQGRRR